jgi:hypothetical protein
VFWSISSTFSSSNSVVLGLSLKSFTHCEWIFIDGERQESSFFLLPIAIQFSQHYLLKKVSFPNICSCCLYGKLVIYKCGFISEFSIGLWDHFLPELFCMAYHGPVGVLKSDIIIAQHCFGHTRCFVPHVLYSWKFLREHILQVFTHMQNDKCVI